MEIDKLKTETERKKMFRAHYREEERIKRGGELHIGFIYNYTKRKVRYTTKDKYLARKINNNLEF